MTALLVRQHTRKKPIDPFEAIRAAKTQQLASEYENALGSVLIRELEEALARDPGFALTVGLAP